jgi:hypothetical protein
MWLLLWSFYDLNRIFFWMRLIFLFKLVISQVKCIRGFIIDFSIIVCDRFNIYLFLDDFLCLIFYLV